MFSHPFFTSNNGYSKHDELKFDLLENRDKICQDYNIFYGTGYSTVHSNSEYHLLYPDFADWVLSNIQPFDEELQIDKMWVNVNPKGGFQMRHNHADADMAGTYYVKVPPGDTGDIYFYHPNHTVETLNRIQPYWAYTHCQIPRERDLYFWPGYNDHEVRQNYENQERWSISFTLKIPQRVREVRYPNLPKTS